MMMMHGIAWMNITLFQYTRFNQLILPGTFHFSRRPSFRRGDISLRTSGEFPRYACDLSNLADPGPHTNKARYTRLRFLAFAVGLLAHCHSSCRPAPCSSLTHAQVANMIYRFSAILCAPRICRIFEHQMRVPIQQIRHRAVFEYLIQDYRTLL